jgi:hypothetical protein
MKPVLAVSEPAFWPTSRHGGATRLRALPLLVVLLLSLQAAQGAEAPEPAASEVTSFEPVMVSGIGRPVVLSRDLLTRVLGVFQAKRAKLAPNASLHFRLAGRGAVQPGERVLAGVVSSATGEPLGPKFESDEQQRFAAELLQQQVVEGSSLRFEKSKSKSGLRPEVRSPASSTNRVRLGDLRLECEVLWELWKPEVPVVMRMGFAAAGGPCRSPRIAFSTAFAQPVVAVRLREGERVVDLSPSKPGRSLSIPLHDETWGHEAVVELEFLPNSAL